MAGQGFQRREILRVIGAAAIASHFAGFSKWAYAAAHPHAASQPRRPGEYTPQFFTAAQFAVISRIAELIIPTDETPGAREAGASEFVDFMVAHDVEQHPHMRAGLAWLDASCQRQFSRAFLDLDEARQISVLEPLAFKARHRVSDAAGQEFFRRVRELTVAGFYSSEVGYRELDNPALQSWGVSPACPHSSDPAHRHLPAAKW